MYLKRKIDDYLEKWKAKPDRLPLIVKGVRQVGKTESIIHFAEKSYANYVYINFALEKEYLNITENGYTADKIIENISLIDPSKKFIAGETLIFFDEIQEYPDIATSLKSFRIDGRFDVICSGSMLGINYRKIHSNSVGNKTDYEMHSMDFEEFLWAVGYSDSQIYNILDHMVTLTPFSTTEMSVYSELFLKYCVLGGMPAIVKKYVESGTFSETLDMQKQILLDYEEDVRKYAEGPDQTKIISVFRSIPSQLAKENKKFQISKVAKNARSREYDGCIEWLNDAGTVNICYCLSFPELPLNGNTDRSKYKLYYPDTGLLIACLDKQAQQDLRANRNLGVYKGALYENFIAEALVKQDLELFYYSKENSQLEEDFFVRTQNNLVPVEVKSNTKSSQSLSTLVSGGHYPDIAFGFKLSAGNIGFANNIYTFPYFCTFMLSRYIDKAFS